MSEPLTQGKVVLKGVGILERGSDLLEGFSLLFCDKFNKIYLFFGSSRWSGFLLIEGTRFTRIINLETAEVDVES